MNTKSRLNFIKNMYDYFFSKKMTYDEILDYIEKSWKPVDENTPKDRVILLYGHIDPKCPFEELN